MRSSSIFRLSTLQTRATCFVLSFHLQVHRHEVNASTALKKSDLSSSLWSSCDELRGGIDASRYRDYVLFLPSSNSSFR